MYNDNNQSAKHVDILTETARYYESCLTGPPRDYVHRRCDSDETICSYHLGYANGGLKNYLLSQDFKEEECIQAGVLIMDDKTGVVRDYFDNSIIIPNYFDDKVAHITARVLDDSLHKYRHIKGKLKHLFNERILSEANLEKIFLAEGPFDTISCTQAGYPCVGLYGISSFSPEVVKFKLKNIKQIFICFDPDNAGKLAAFRFAVALGNKAKIISLSKSGDLNEFFNN